MSIKQDRIQERIRIILSETLLREVSDPRLQGLTVTDVAIDNELMYATVYVNALGDESREEEVMQALERANGFLRRQVGQGLTTRNTPELHFKWDASLAYGERINQILDGLDIPTDDEGNDA